jgi:antitoxin PrlF
MEIARILAKGRITIPKRIRTAAGLVVGDVIAFEVLGSRVTFRKLPMGDDLYLHGVGRTLSEWDGAEDDHAWRDL